MMSMSRLPEIRTALGKLTRQVQALQRRLDHLQAEMDRLAAEAREELEAVHRSYRKELVPLSSPGQIIVLTDQRRGKR
jgi:prefoldin subunit 5